MYHPTFNDVQSLSSALPARLGEHGKTRRPLLPLYCDLLADVETPVSAYCKAARGPYTFLLESVAGGEHIARYSFIGLDPYLVLTHRDDRATLHHMPHDEKVAYVETIACYDPLELVQTELEQFYLVSSQSK